jgi:hypothetical protein
MALKAAYDIRCSCGATFIGDVYEYVFAEHDPDLKDAILSGEFNRVSCPSCGHGLPVDSRYLYRDEKNNLCVWVCSKEDEPKREVLARELIETNSRVEFHFLDGAGPGRKLLVFGREALICLLLREDPVLRKSEGRHLKNNPAVRLFMEGRGDAGYLLLRGKKIRVCMPFRFPGDPAGPAAGPEAVKKWMRHYTFGLNIHNPYSSFLTRRLKSEWDRIREEEPPGDSRNEFDDFAESWARSRIDSKGFKARYPARSRYFDGLRGFSVPRKVRSLRVGHPR